MKDISSRLAALSQEQRELLLQRLKDRQQLPSMSHPTSEEDSSAQPIVRHPRSGSLPLSFAQRRLWYLDQLDQNSPLYNTYAALHLSGPLDTATLEAALNALVARHEALRTSIVTVDGQPSQVIAPTLHLPLMMKDLRDISSELRESTAQRLITGEVQRPFELAQPPLLRSLLLRLDEQTHVLVLTVHHIICDEWSIDILFRELTTFYNSALVGKLHDVHLPDPTLQYVDFAAWQRQRLAPGSSSAVLEKQLSYWQRQFATLPPVLELPTDRRRQAGRSVEGASYAFTLPTSLAEGLQTLSQSESATLFMTLLAGFQVLLARYSNMYDPCVGVPVAGRTRLELEPIVGFFVNTLALRTDLSGNPSFREVLRRVREVALGAYAHQDLPFEKLIDHLQVERNVSHTPLFQVMFVLQRASTPSLQLTDLSVRPLTIDWGAAHFDLTLSIVPQVDGLTGLFEYSTDLFDRATIARMATQFHTLLAGVVAQPDRLITDLPLLSDAERCQILHDWNQTETAYPQHTCVHQLIEDQAARTPDAIAVIFGKKQLTYRELNQRANQVAYYLRQQGVGGHVQRETIVGLCLSRSLDVIVALLGVLKAGAAYLPLDPTHPPERLRFMLGESDVLMVLCHQRYQHLLPSESVRPLALDAEWEQIARLPDTNPVNSAQSEQLAYVLYTSGSTGRPKGVMIPHRGLVNYLSYAIQAYAVAEGVGAPVHSPLSFDLTVTSLFTPLLVGRRVVLLPEERGIEMLETTLRTERDFSLVKLTPIHMQALSQSLAPADIAGSTRALVIGGEALTIEHIAFWQRHAPTTRLLNEYGPTETVVGCCVYEVPTETGSAAPIPIGHPIANTRLYILDAFMQPVPIGVTGELYIGGAGVGRGYISRADLTAERFVPDPFGPLVGARLYKSGDLARYRADGVIEYLGRIDDQVKIRGFRIELGEIEASLLQYPQVRECAVIVSERSPSDKRLVAYVVEAQANMRIQEQETSESGLQNPESGADLRHRMAGDEELVAGLRRYLSECLPDYMVPSAFVVLDALPHSANGKIDRRALPKADFAPALGRGDFVAPRTAVEQTLAEIWAQVLRIERVGVYDNFFSLGGDSILIIQIVARARQAGLQMIPRQMFQQQTIADLAPVVGLTALKPEDQEPVIGPVPLTPIQQWFFEADSTEPQYFNQALLLEPRERLDLALLENVFQGLVTHHDALRLRFKQTAQRWEQYNAAPLVQPIVQLRDLSSVAVAEQPTRMTEFASTIQASLNLHEGPLVRAVLFDCGSDRTARLLIVVHHLVVDGVSWSILLSDLETGYRQLRHGEPLALPRKSTSFKRWAERLVVYAASDLPAAEIDHWYMPLISTPLPRDHATGTNARSAAQEVAVTLDAETTRALLQVVPRVYRTQINDLLLAALARTFQDWTGSDQLLIDLEGHGREDLFDDCDISRTVGWFTTIYPVLLDLRYANNLNSLLKRVKEQLRRVPQRGINYGILRYLSPDRQMSAALGARPRAEINFNYLGQIDSDLAPDSFFRPAHEPIGATESPLMPRRYLLEVTSAVMNGELRVRWTYSIAIHQPATIERLAQNYLSALRDLLAHCRADNLSGYSPSDFPLAHLDQATLERLVGVAYQIEDLYPLSPLQQGMLFHTLYESGTGMYITQVASELKGALDMAALQRAWQTIAERHPVFRTGIIWANPETPLQVVRRHVALPWQIEDWRSLSVAKQRSRLAAFMVEDRRQEFVLAESPLIRFALFRIGEAAYYFVRTNHHLLLDGWSSPIVFNEVWTCYQTFVRGKQPQLPLVRPYRDYIAWLQRQDTAQAERFWRDTLAGFTAPTLLSIDRGRRQTAEGAEHTTHELLLSEEVSERLKQLARQHGLTLNTVVQGVWALLLSRYSGDSDVVFGATVSGRAPDLAGAEQIVGVLINTLPMRVHVPAQVAILPWLQELQQHLSTLREYQYNSLIQIHGWSEVSRRQPLFESLVVFENYPEQLTALDDEQSLTITRIESVEQDNYPLALLVAPDSNWRIQINFDRRRFEEALIARMAGHFELLLTTIMVDSARALTELSLLTQGERQQILSDWNTTQADYPQYLCIHQLVAAQATRTPDAIAAVFQQQRLTYTELERRANHLAHQLQRLGVGPEVLVGICTDRSLDLVVGLLAVLKAGGAYLPLDPKYPTERLEFMLHDAQAHVLLTQSSLAEQIPVAVTHTLYLDQMQWSSEPVAAPTSTVTSDNLAYVIYTSGSTGRPKGVAIAHRSTVALLTWASTYVAADEVSVVLAATSVCFDLSVYELFLPLCRGGSVLLVEDVLHLASLPPDLGVSLINTVPSVMIDLLRVAVLPESVRTVNLAGEPVPLNLVQQLYRQPTLQRVVNLYGPTEDTTYSTVALLSRDHQSPPPIGQPIANTQAYILDRWLNLVPVGLPGELYLGGAGLARGYLNRPDLTAERFVPNPFSDLAGSRLYKTGDLVRWQLNGQIEYLGRADQQVKLRGFRIELGEIEAALRQHPHIDDTVVVVREDTPDDKRLVAYVVPKASAEQAALNTDTLRIFLQATLPDYMLPLVIQLASLPLTLNGKVDRKRLPAPDTSRPALETTFVAPSGETEQIIARIWQHTLKVEQIGIHDNFFDLGGHSLLMLQVFNELQASFSKPISLVEMFRLPTIHLLARYFSQEQSDAGFVDRMDAAQERARRKADALNRKGQFRKGTS